MQRPELEALAERRVPGHGPIELLDSRTGLAHDTCRVTRDGRAFSLRVPAERNTGIEIDRRWEASVIETAAAAGLAPRPYYADPDHGVLILEWVEGATWSEAEARQPARQRAMATALRRLHALPIPEPRREVMPADWVARYRAAGASGGEALDREADGRLALLDRETRPHAAARGDGRRPLPKVLCHGDLHVLNVVDRGDSLVLLDFEYAQVSEPFWDLAGWCANNDLDAGSRRVLWSAYREEAGREAGARDSLELHRLEALIWLYDYVCLLWGRLYLRRRAGAGEAEIAIQARAEQVARRLEAGASGGPGQVPAH